MFPHYCIVLLPIYYLHLSVCKNGLNQRVQRRVRRGVRTSRCAAKTNARSRNRRGKQVRHPFDLQSFLEFRDNFRDLIDRTTACAKRFHKFVAFFATGNRVVFLNKNQAVRRFGMGQIKTARRSRRFYRCRRFAKPTRVNLPAAFVVFIRKRNAGFKSVVLEKVVYKNFAEYRINRLDRVKFERGRQAFRCVSDSSTTC